MRPSEQLAETCDAVARLNAKYGSKSTSSVFKPIADVGRILAALEEFMECVRYLNTRRTAGASLTLDSEAAVQDAVYLMLRPWISDLVPENPTDRVASRYTIQDFVSRSAQAVIEAKFIRDREHGKSISRELHDDIETYRHHPSCRHLVFFVYDPDVHIPDRAALARQICVERMYDGKPLTCYLVVKP